MMDTHRRPFPSKAFNDFSKKEVIDFLEILHFASQVMTEEDVGKLFHLTSRRIPCQKMVAGLLKVDATGKSTGFCKLINISYPLEWVSLYLKRQYADVDPVLRYHIQSGSKSQIWANTCRRAGSPKGQEFIEEAHGFGLVNGLTTGRFEPDRGLSSFFSFANDAAPVPERYRAVLEYLSHYLHGALLKIAPATSGYSIDILSPREKTVLDWMRHGKTNWEISRILGVSERTVRFHVEGIFSKLDVSSRTQAVAYAIENGLLAVQ